MTARMSFGAEVKVLAKAKASSNGTTPVVFNFGSPTDIYVPGLTGYVSNMRLIFLLDSSRAAGTTTTVTYTFQDAPDNAGAINTGQLATAVTATSTALTAGLLTGAATGDFYTAVSVQIQGGSTQGPRPWLRISSVCSDATDVMIHQVTLLGIPVGLI